MITAKIIQGGYKKMKRKLKRVHQTGRGGIQNIIRFGAKDGIRAMIAQTGKPYRGTTSYIWADDSRESVIKLKKSIPTPGAGFGRAGWARAAQTLHMTGAAKYGYGPGSATKRLTGTEPFLSATNSVYYVPNMDAGRPLPGIPHRKPSYRGPHVHPRSSGIIRAGMAKAEKTFVRQINRTIERMESNWRS